MTAERRLHLDTLRQVPRLIADLSSGDSRQWDRTSISGSSPRCCCENAGPVSTQMSIEPYLFLEQAGCLFPQLAAFGLGDRPTGAC